MNSAADRPDATKVFVEQAISSIVLPVPPAPYFDDEYCISDTPQEQPQESLEEEIAGIVEIKSSKLPHDYEKITPQYPHVSFEPDNFQKQCFYYINKAQSIFVTAHTSSGKTLIAKYAIYISELHDTRMIYTSPIKALSNQKYREFAMNFTSVGILTGDAQINSTAKCLVMTTEILRNMLYRGSTILDDVEFIVFDEIHYLGDKERGVVWEEVIIMLPRHINFIFLSATSPNAKDMCNWISVTKNKEMYLIGTEKRAVELEHGIHFRGELFMLIQGGKFNRDEYMRAKSTGLVEKFKEKQKANAALQKKPEPVAKKKASTVLATPIPIVRGLMQHKLAPIVFFDFSKSRIEQSFSMCDSLDLTTSEEKSLIREFIGNALQNLPKTDRSLPQINFMLPNLIRGVGMHHSGLLPILKEVVEMLFTTGALRVLFSTETLAMGLNMPARTVVIRTTKKYSSETRSYVDISVGEYMQMAGRAGRRGYDIKGTVILECAGQEMHPESFFVKLQTGTADPIESNFYITARMILKLLRVKSVSIKEMIRLSFGKSKVEQKIRKALKIQKSLKAELLHSVISCEICADLFEYISKYCQVLAQLASVYSIGVDKSNPEYIIIQGSINEIAKTPHYAILRKSSQNSSRAEEPKETVTLVFDRNTKSPAAIPRKDLKVLQIQTKTISAWKALDKFTCFKCEKFQEHYLGYLNEYTVRDRIKSIDNELTSTNTSGLACNNYFNYIMFLRHLDYLDNLDNIKIKGKIAYEFNSIECVLATEVLLSHRIAGIKTSHLIIALVGLTFYEKYQLKEEADRPEEEERIAQIKALRPALDIIDEIVYELCPLYKKYKIRMELPNHAFCGELALWLDNKKLAEIIDASPLSEGVIVKYIKKATEICTEISIAAKIMGNPQLLQEVEEINKNLKRGIVFTPSLYYG